MTSWGRVITKKQPIKGCERGATLPFSIRASQAQEGCAKSDLFAGGVGSMFESFDDLVALETISSQKYRHPPRPPGFPFLLL